ncbi:N-acetylmuramoyl-L-alanine amidase [Phycisphaera mikurensis]|uniref:N-acetylmuramoyl-L-alanine amidase n=1 Tax=Phycisphaera mikurensis (strain NBRC 102666 / KCTC 22515 / FYK2301M01) TaxID=1142394 RepID=I0IFF1_PHYMF|nr:N-acetylmuramoyl-L-alanine amidase [Phycisphaera mikurensis]MBB6440619.1 N-acetyl-anhydromuramyl-L-alanine amidase AmpD [Phycisphaera mikurensis]BAM03989.1 N-acetylmuramoyl-L-alanine amidase [Phycisphaera mikurensis NBRC 102666]
MPHPRLLPPGPAASLLAVLACCFLLPAPAHAALFGDNPVDLPIKEFVASPNHNNRPAGVTVDTVVIHTTEGSLGGTLSWLQNPVSQVSAHFVIAQNGDLYQMVNSRKRAWHATYYNARSIGVEMVGYAGRADTWNDANLATLASVLAWSSVEFGIELERPLGNAYGDANNTFRGTGLVGHAQIQPWNKSDPGVFFPWDRVEADARAVVAAAVPEPGTAAALLITLGCLCRGRRAA